MRDLAGLAPAIDQRGYLYVCPNAPVTISMALDTPGRLGMSPVEIQAQQRWSKR